MEQYQVTGMSCAACQAHVEKAVAGVPGVTSCAVSLLTNSMTVDGTADEKDIVQAVERAGYGASPVGKEGGSIPGSVAAGRASGGEALKDTETPRMLRRLVCSAAVLLVLMYFSMGYMMWGFPVPAIFRNPIGLAILEMLLALVVLMINRRFFISGTRGAFHGAPNMDTLVALGSAASFGYSLVALFLMADAMSRGDQATVKALSMKHIWFETSAMIPTLITIGKTLESYSKGRTTDALKSLMKLSPKTAVILREGEEKKVSIEEVRIGDTFVVRPGENIPVDGVVIEGSSAVNEATLTGESIPVDKQQGDSVSAATLNQSGYLKARAARVGEDTTLSQIIRLVSEAAATKAPIARIADKVSAVFVPVVLLIAAAALIGWLMIGKDPGFAFPRAVAVLVISCPCALGLATPVAIMVGNGVGAGNGILYKTAASLETVGRTQVVALDKTGTITNGTPVVTDVIVADGCSEDELFIVANAVEMKSEHPLAKAVTAYLSDRKLSAMPIAEFEALPGNGLKAVVEGTHYYAGNVALVGQKVGIPEKTMEQAVSLSEEGKTPLFFAAEGRLLGVIAVADTVKEDSSEAIRQLKNMGIHVVMLTGDNVRTAGAIGKIAGVDQVVAGVLPDGKEKVIRKLQGFGKTVMVGDGINDAPALTAADTGIAIGAGADVAIDAADVVLMKNSLMDVAAAIRLSRAVIRNIHENLFWAFFYNAICIPLAIGLYQVLFGLPWELKPAIGALAMSFSSVTVCLNALRLNLFRPYDARRDRRISGVNSDSSEFIIDYENNQKEKEKERMTKTVKIKGMMCEHCEMAVKKALEAMDGVESAKVSHTEGTAVVLMTKEIPEDAFKKAVEAKDYEFVSVE